MPATEPDVCRSTGINESHRHTAECYPAEPDAAAVCDHGAPLSEHCWACQVGAPVSTLVVDLVAELRDVVVGEASSADLPRLLERAAAQLERLERESAEKSQSIDTAARGIVNLTSRAEAAESRVKELEQELANHRNG